MRRIGHPIARSAMTDFGPADISAARREGIGSTHPSGINDAHGGRSETAMCGTFTTHKEKTASVGQGIKCILAGVQRYRCNQNHCR